jgi:hypothetical protein
MQVFGAVACSGFGWDADPEHIAFKESGGYYLVGWGKVYQIRLNSGCC